MIMENIWKSLIAIKTVRIILDADDYGNYMEVVNCNQNSTNHWGCLSYRPWVIIMITHMMTVYDYEVIR